MAVISTLGTPAGVANMTPKNSFLVRCAVPVVEVLIMTNLMTLMIMAYGIISMDLQEPGHYQLMGHHSIGQEMMATTVALGATMMAKQILEPGRTLTILNQVNGSQQLKIHIQDISL